MKILLLIFLLIPFVVHSQLSIAIVENELEVQHSDLQLTYYPLGDFKPLEWQPGTAYYPNGTSKTFEGMRYNLPKDRAEVNANGTILPIYPGIVTGVSMGAEDNINHLFINVPLEPPVFMELVAVGKIDLLVFRKIKPDDVVDTAGATNSVRFVKEEEKLEYTEELYVWHNGIIEEYKSSKNFLLKIMSDHADEIEAYMKENKTKLKNPQSVVPLFQYYNQL